MSKTLKQIIAILTIIWLCTQIYQGWHLESIIKNHHTGLLLIVQFACFIFLQFLTAFWVSVSVSRYIHSGQYSIHTKVQGVLILILYFYWGYNIFSLLRELKIF